MYGILPYGTSLFVLTQESSLPNYVFISDNVRNVIFDVIANKSRRIRKGWSFEKGQVSALPITEPCN